MFNQMQPYEMRKTSFIPLNWMSLIRYRDHIVQIKRIQWEYRVFKNVPGVAHIIEKGWIMKWEGEIMKSGTNI